VASIARRRTNALMMAMFTSIARSLLRTLESIDTPCSVKANGVCVGHRDPLLLHFAIAKPGLFAVELKHEVRGETFWIPPDCKIQVAVVTPYNSAKSSSNITL